jgi:SAM-dependent methyltransferase
MERVEWLKQMRDKVEAIYDHFSAQDSPETVDDAWKQGCEPHVQYLQTFLGWVAPCSILLSAGCGSGRYDGMLLEAGHSVVGIDLSAGMLAQAKKRYPKIRYEKMALHEMNFQNEFDGAICIEALEHVFPEEWPEIMHGFREALKPGGMLYFTVDISVTGRFLEESYEKAKSRELPVVFGELAGEVDVAFEKVMTAEDGNVPDELTDPAVYHYYPGVEQVRKWLEQEKFAIEAEGTGTFTWGSDDALTATYDHFVVRKR